MDRYEHLRPFAETDAQLNMLDAMNNASTVPEAAEILGISVRNTFQMLKRLKKNAAARGVSPEHDMTH